MILSDLTNPLYSCDDVKLYKLCFSAQDILSLTYAGVGAQTFLNTENFFGEIANTEVRLNDVSVSFFTLSLHICYTFA